MSKKKTKIQFYNIIRGLRDDNMSHVTIEQLVIFKR